MTSVRLHEGVWRPGPCTVVILHLTSTKNRMVKGQKIFILENILLCHLSPDEGVATVMVRACLADLARPSDRYHGATDMYGNDAKYIQRKLDMARRNTTLPVDVATYKDYTD